MLVYGRVNWLQLFLANFSQKSFKFGLCSSDDITRLSLPGANHSMWWTWTLVSFYSKLHHPKKLQLVGGWTNPSEKYVCQIGSFCQVGENKIKKCLKPSPSQSTSWSETTSCWPLKSSSIQPTPFSSAPISGSKKKDGCFQAPLQELPWRWGWKQVNDQKWPTN